ncbi:MAG: hypothetical protein IKK93_11510 [Campylobacter sp.]|nr:hypothetical protein [Campylobacter sp.]
MSIIEIIERERLNLAESADCDTKQYLSNEFFYEKLFNQIHWDKNHMVTEGEVSKLALRAMIEMAYREGKIDGLERASEIIVQNQP